METFWLILALILMLLGLVGTVVPLLPGTTLILAAAIGHRLVTGAEGGLGYGQLGVLLALYLLSVLVDFLSSALGAKRFGASRLGIVGGLLGTVVGLFFGLPGIFLGPLVGAIVGELLAMRCLSRVMKAGLGTFLGTILGIAGRLTLAALMIATFLLSIVLF